MFKVHYIICNTGDGSNHLEWYKQKTYQELQELEGTNFEKYSSGDGIQIGMLYFATQEQLDHFIASNPHIYWDDDTSWSEYDEESF